MTSTGPGPCLALLALSAALSACSAASTQESAPAPVRPAPAAVIASRAIVPLPQGRHGHRIEALPGGLLSFGGDDHADATADRGEHACFWLGDGDTAWRRCADMAQGRGFFGSGVVDGVCYAIGDGVERYDRAADRWVEVAAPGTLPKSHFAAAAVGRELFVLGGYPIERSAIFVVDSATGAIRREQPPPGFQPGDHFHFLAAIRGELHLVGGLDVTTFIPRRQHFVRRGEAWQEQQPPPPEGLWAKFGGQAVVGDRWFLFGDFGTYVGDLAAAPAERWRRCAPPPQITAMPGTVAIGDSVWVLGGMIPEGGSAKRPLVFDLATLTWRD